MREMAAIAVILGAEEGDRICILTLEEGRYECMYDAGPHMDLS